MHSKNLRQFDDTSKMGNGFVGSHLSRVAYCTHAVKDTARRYPYSARVMEDLTKRIKTAITRTGKSIADLAEDLGINRSAIYQWIDGSTEPAPTNLFLLARKANVRPEWLLLNELPMELDSETLAACGEIKEVLHGIPAEKLDPIIREVIEFAKFKRKSA